jgi:hypothetical protein
MIKRLLTDNLKQPFLIAFLFSTLLSILRLKVRFVEPLLWGEDGADLFFGIFCNGRAGVFEPVIEQYMPLQKIITWFSYTISPYYFAEQLSFYSILIFSLCTSYVAKPTFRNLIPNDPLRILMAVALPLSPGSFELIGNLNSITNFFTWLLCLVILELSLNKATILRGLGASALILLNPLSFMALPLLVLNWTRVTSRVKYLIISVGVLSLSFAAFNSATVGLKDSHLNLAKLVEIPLLLPTTFFGYSILNPFLGSELTNLLISQGRVPFLMVGGVLFCWLIYLLFQDKGTKLIGLTVWSAPLTYTAAHLVTRTSVIDPIKLGQMPIFGRSNFLFFASSLLIAFSFSKIENATVKMSKVLKLSPLILFMAILIPSTIKGLSVGYGPFDPSWSEFRSYLSQSNDKSVWEKSFNIYPADQRDGKVYAWANLKVSKSEQAIACTLAGGNLGMEQKKSERLLSR